MVRNPDSEASAHNPSAERQTGGSLGLAGKPIQPNCQHPGSVRDLGSKKKVEVD